MSRRRIWFTPEKANSTLPFVREVVADILAKGRELRELLDGNESAAEDEVRHAKNEMLALMGELERLGCAYRDWTFDVGLVDFPAVMDGEEVMLCWRSDEAEVTWYHSPESGYAGRKPIPDDWLRRGDSSES